MNIRLQVDARDRKHVCVPYLIVYDMGRVPGTAPQTPPGCVTLQAT